MASNGSSSKKDLPTKDPLQVLGLELGVSDSEISKAYRKLARTLHPDKLRADVDRDAAAQQFQDIQTARAFLLDPEFATAREKYFKKQASDQLRRETQAARDAAQSAQRRRMRQELHENEVVHKKPSSKDILQEQGRKLREKYAAQQASEASVERTERQVRLKWSRKQLAAEGEPSPSEDSIAQNTAAQFGTVVDVMMIGSKGNVALVTFAESASCDAIVDGLATSVCWRATYVNEESKRRYEDRKSKITETVEKNNRDGESVLAWKERRDAQRETLLREMETGQRDDGSGRPFPPSFPEECEGSALEKLQQAEREILKDLIGVEMLQKMTFATS